MEKMYYVFAINMARLFSSFKYDLLGKIKFSRYSYFWRIVHFLIEHKNEIMYLTKDKFKLLELDYVFSIRNININALELYFKEKGRMFFFKRNGKIYVQVKDFTFLLPFPQGIFELIEVFYNECYGNIDISGGTVIDVGAFIGDSSVYFASKGAKEVIAYEPLPFLYKIAKENVVINRLTQKISLRNEAIGDRTGKIKIYENLNWLGKSSIFKRSPKLYEVTVVPLHEVIFSLGYIDLLKMDCEGCEYISMKNAFKKEALVNVKNIIIETHGNSSSILNILRKASFKIKEIKGSGYNQIIYAIKD